MSSLADERAWHVFVSSLENKLPHAPVSTSPVELSEHRPRKFCTAAAKLDQILIAVVYFCRSVNIMSLALKWLEGSEKEVELIPSLAVLLGQWKDLNGSMYMLTRGSETDKIDVFTVRPSGAERYTEALISLRGCNLQWGRSTTGKYSLENASSITWRRGSSKFYWRKMQ